MERAFSSPIADTAHERQGDKTQRALGRALQLDPQAPFQSVEVELPLQGPILGPLIETQRRIGQVFGVEIAFQEIGEGIAAGKIHSRAVILKIVGVR
jgi:hypothetical protein